MLLNLIATSAALLASVSAVPPPLDRNGELFSVA